MELYTPIEEAGKLIRKRWADKSLREAVEQKLGGDIPEILKDGPSGMIGRCIGTPDGEFERFLKLCQKADLKPVCFEYLKDKFYHGNFTKYGLVNLAFFNGVDKNHRTIVKKEKIIDFEKVKGKTLRMCDLETVWKENLAEFHHSFLLKVFPVMANRVIDTSNWFSKSKNRAESFYELIFSLSICHIVLFEDFDLLEEEDKFTNEIVIPVYDKIKERFGIKPIIVKISNVGEHDNDPFWWRYSKQAEEIAHNHIKTFKC